VALDYWAAKYILHPIDNNAQHHPDFPLVNTWLTSARDLINDRGGLYDPDNAIYVRDVTKNEASMLVRTLNLAYRSVPPIIELLLQD
jgi:predicted pyridoxine 5'-phosphate oxidase superfamily flavin-nucleotide-binding protein